MTETDQRLVRCTLPVSKLTEADKSKRSYLKTKCTNASSSTQSAATIPTEGTLEEQRPQEILFDPRGTDAYEKSTISLPSSGTGKYSTSKKASASPSSSVYANCGICEGVEGSQRPQEILFDPRGSEAEGNSTVEWDRKCTSRDIRSSTEDVCICCICLEKLDELYGATTVLLSSRSRR